MLNRKLTQAKIPMCPECARDTTGALFESEWICPHCGHCSPYRNYGYYASDVPGVVEEMKPYCHVGMPMPDRATLTRWLQGLNNSNELSSTLKRRTTNEGAGT